MLAATASVLTALTACSSGSAHPQASAAPTTGTQARSLRSSTAPALLAQCAISQGVTKVLDSVQQYIKSHPGGDNQFLHGTAIRLTYDNGGAFTDWYENSTPPNFAIIGGKALFDTWPMIAADQDRLPTAVCGSGASARKIYSQVYAHWPSLLNQNPWGT